MDLLFPKICLGCKSCGSYLCESCFKKIALESRQSCPACSRKNISGTFCDTRCKKDFYFDQLITCMVYDKTSFLKKLIALFKYKFSEELSEVFGKILIKQFKKLRNLIPDSGSGLILIPVPLHKKRLKFRGFNQAQLLADYLTKNIDGVYVYDALERKIYTKEQAKLNKNDRLKNLKNTIGLKADFCRDIIKNKTVILIDDVATTGSTLNECSRVLKEAGAKYICGLTLARAELFC